MSQRLFLQQTESEKPFQRNEFLCKAIDNNFELVANEKRESGYIETGAATHGFVLNNISSDNNMMLSEKISTASSLPLIQCDIGAGDFSYNKANDSTYGNQVVTYGVTAKDFRSEIERKKETPPTYIIGKNAEYMSEIFKDIKFDFIFSHKTFCHFVDPIGSLIEAYRTLKQGGIMYIDRFSIHGCEKFTAALLEYLEKDGYLVLGSGENGAIDHFIIQKTKDKPELNIPLSFSHIDRDPEDEVGTSKFRYAYYKPTTELIKFQQSSLNKREELYQIGREMFAEKSKQYASLLSQCPDVVTLLNNQEYQNLDNKTQYEILLCLVAKNIDSFSKAEELIKKGLGQDNKYTSFNHAYQSNMQSNNINNFTTLFYLPYDYYFRENSGPQQLRILQFFAAQDLLLHTKSELTKQKLQAMGLPFQEEPQSQQYDEGLLYPKIASECKMVQRLQM